MPNIASVLKEEITRLARKEVKVQADPMAEKLVELRRVVSALRKQVADLAKTVGDIKGRVKSDEIISADDVADQDVEKSRITGGRIAAMRAKLGLSRNQMALLLGVNANSIYLWEQGKTRPRAAAKAKIMQLRGLGKRAVAKLVKSAKAAAKGDGNPSVTIQEVKPKRRRRKAAKAVVAAPVAQA
jgi:DNA-binding transcriptional regulator YiaG